MWIMNDVNEYALFLITTQIRYLKKNTKNYRIILNHACLVYIWFNYYCIYYDIPIRIFNCDEFVSSTCVPCLQQVT